MLSVILLILGNYFNFDVKIFLITSNSFLYFKSVLNAKYKVFSVLIFPFQTNFISFFKICSSHKKSGTNASPLPFFKHLIIEVILGKI
ncbi:hypothetical protein OBPA_08510 [Polaribacter sp. OB-PA-B3]